MRRSRQLLTLLRCWQVGCGHCRRPIVHPANVATRLRLQCCWRAIRANVQHCVVAAVSVAACGCGGPRPRCRAAAESQEEYDMCLVHARQMQRRTAADGDLTRQHIPVPEPGEIHADHLGAVRPGMRDAAHGAVRPQKMDDYMAEV